jgi:hypothetical protein
LELLLAGSAATLNAAAFLAVEEARAEADASDSRVADDASLERGLTRVDVPHGGWGRGQRGAALMETPAAVHSSREGAGGAFFAWGLTIRAEHQQQLLS